MLVPLAFIITNCGNKNDNNSSTPVASGYYYNQQTGNCYSAGNNIQVSSQLCSQSTCYMVNNVYYMTNTNQPTTAAYCQQYNGYNNGYNNGYSSQQCVGIYYYQGGYGGYTQTTCQGYNCSGATLYNQSGQMVRCL
jgi:hypothetical protein